MKKENAEVRVEKKQYISLIELILRNIKDIDSIKRIYEFAQDIWHKENANMTSSP